MTEDDFKIVEKMIATAISRMNNMIRFGEVVSLKDGDTQSAQLRSANNEILDNVKFLEPYGITVKPPVGSETVSFNIMGNPGNVVILNIGNRNLRFKELNDGEVCIYDDSGNLIHLKNGGKMKITSPNMVTIETSVAEIIADKVTIKADEVNLGAEGGLPIAYQGALVAPDPVTGELKVQQGSTIGKVKP